MIDTSDKTLQQVSDEMAAKLIAQGKPCVTSNGDSCAYTDGKGNHCAIGWLLPDSDYIKDYMETITTMVANFSNEKLGSNASFLKEHVKELSQLQMLHDYDIKYSREIHQESIQERFNLDMSAWDEWVNNPEMY